MSIITSPMLLGADTGGAYQISRSLRFNSAGSAYLNRTFGSAGNRKTWTWAGWVKRTAIATQQAFFSNNIGLVSGSIQFGFLSDGTFFCDRYLVGTFVSTAVFRDPSAWYHVVISCDTTRASGRIKTYVNNTEVFSNNCGLSQNNDTSINQASSHVIGRDINSGSYFSGYLAEVHFIDGQALDPSSFTETDATTGQLIPKAYGGTYGSNGFKLSFSDNSTTAALGTDTSGNGNTWTVNNLSVTAGSGNDSLVDTPTSYGTDTGVGGEVRGNYCTLNPLDQNASPTYTNGNLDVSIPIYASSTTPAARGSIVAASGSYYWEITYTTANSGGLLFGVAAGAEATKDYSGGSGTYVVVYAFNGNKYVSGTSSSYATSFAQNDVIGVALNVDSGTITFYKNNTSQGSITLPSSTSGWKPVVANTTTGGANNCTLNFGQRAFAYPLSGFKALCDTNLPTPVVAKPNTVMDVVLYTGTGAALTPTSSLGFNPDWIWIKSRSAATDHALYDVVRGAQARLESNTTDAEVTTDGGVTAFNSAGFTLGTLGQVNTSSATYAAWCWDAGTSTVTNTAGSISSQVRVNASAGFSVVTYTGTGANATVGHGLGVAANLVIVKRRDTTANWQVRHTSIAAASSIQLNLTNAAASATTVWNSTAPSSTVFSIGTDATINASAGTYVAYCFAPVAGYSNGFSYTGNGSADGVFQFLGFRPRLIMLKRSDSTSNWTLLDTSREGYNVDNDPLYPNLSDAEGTTDLLDITSNGFKLRSTDASVNASAGTYIGFAWAENPFQYARAR